MTVAIVKAALLTALKGLPALSGVQVVYGDGDTRRRESARLRESSTAEMEPVGMRPGRHRRDETYTVEVEFETIGKPTPEKSEVRAVEMLSALDIYLADNVRVGLPPESGVLSVVLSGWELDTGQAGEGVRSVLTATLTVKARSQ